MASTNIHVVHSEEAVIDVPDTGFETMLSQPTNNNIANGGIVSYIPLVFVLVGIILALSAFCINTKKKHDKKKGMNLNTKTRSQMTRAIYISAFAMAAVGVGGTVYLKNQASAATDGLNVVGDLYATLVERDDISSIYCGTDNLKLSTANTQGYMIRMNGSTLQSQSEEADLISIEDWGNLTPGTWGFFTDYTQHGTEGSEENSFVPIPQRNGVITNTIEVNSEEETVPVTFCARVSNDTPEGEYVGVVNYENIMFAIPGAGDTGNTLTDESYIDYNSKGDFDGDGVIDRKENQIGTNVLYSDTDADMISDGEELYIYGTNPFDGDTDGDTITDYSELALMEQGFDFNPIGQNDKDKFIDGYHYVDEVSGIEMDLHGTGNLPQTYVNAQHVETVADSKAHLFSFETDGELAEADDAAVVTIPYEEGDFTNYGTMSEMTFNSVNDDGEIAEDGFGIVNLDEENKEITIELPHFSSYTVEPGKNEDIDPMNPMSIVIKTLRELIKTIIAALRKTGVDPVDQTISFSEDAAQKLINYYKSSAVSLSQYGLDRKDNCFSITKWWIKAFTTIKNPNINGPGGRDVVYNLTTNLETGAPRTYKYTDIKYDDSGKRIETEGTATISYGKTPKPMSVFSITDNGGTAKCTDRQTGKSALCGHTGVIIGIKEDGSAITIEAAYDNPSYTGVKIRYSSYFKNTYTSDSGKYHKNYQDYVVAYLGPFTDYQKLNNLLESL